MLQLIWKYVKKYSSKHECVLYNLKMRSRKRCFVINPREISTSLKYILQMFKTNIIFFRICRKYTRTQTLTWERSVKIQANNTQTVLNIQMNRPGNIDWSFVNWLTTLWPKNRGFLNADGKYNRFVGSSADIPNWNMEKCALFYLLSKPRRQEFH